MNDQLIEVATVAGPWMGIMATIVLATRQVNKDQTKRDRERRLHQLKVKSVSSSTLRKYINAKTLDPTKRKSLQPTAEKKIPVGWTAEDEELWEQANKVPRKSPNGPVRPLAPIRERDLRTNEERRRTEGYHHKFFGSRLKVEGQIIKQGMTNSVHTLEVTTGDKVYIDGEPVSINPSDVQKIKFWLEKIQDA